MDCCMCCCRQHGCTIQMIALGLQKMGQSRLCVTLAASLVTTVTAML